MRRQATRKTTCVGATLQQDAGLVQPTMNLATIWQPDASTPALQAAWQRSNQLLHVLRESLASRFADDKAVSTIAVSGSLGRREATPRSDGDVIVVMAEGVSGQGESAMSQVHDMLQAVGLDAAKPSGIYAQTATHAALADPTTRGRIADDITVFGQRMQLLVESQCLYGDDACSDLLDAILSRFTVDVPRRNDGIWRYLTNELVRYYKSSQVSSQWKFSHERGGWWLYDLKARFSRTVAYAGLCLLLGESSRQPDAVAWLRGRLHLTPMQRIEMVFGEWNDDGFTRIVDRYERFVALLADKSQRDVLHAAAPRGLADLNQGNMPIYDTLCCNADDLRAELVRFIMARRDDWPGRWVDRFLF